MKKSLLFILFSIVGICLFAQDDKPKATRSLTKWEKRFGEVKYKDNIYQKGSNWFSFGLGGGYHINSGGSNQNISLAYHHRFKGVYFNIGWHYSSPKFLQLKPLKIVRAMEMVNDFHAGAGLRFEGRWWHYSFFIGPSFATTWIPDELNPKISHIKNQLGAHVEMQFIFKYLYDLGVGTSLYGSFNKRYQVVGAQLTFYFSNAFKMKY